MSRGLVYLAFSTSIPVSVWEKEDPRTLATALDVLREETEKASRRAGGDSPGTKNVVASG